MMRPSNNINILALAAALIGLDPHPVTAATSTSSVVLPAGTVIGSVSNGVEHYNGIPYARPPVGPLRLKPPVRLARFSSGSIQATGVGPSCPQATQVEITPLLLDVLSLPGAQETLFFGTASGGDESEDCLTVSVMRPQGTKAKARLPVLFWIFGGGFETGSTQAYNGSVLIPQSVSQGKPMILVAVNYRLGAFGFLGGREVLAGGAANLGLLDQRMGLEWVADNIAAFGGDPNKVTIWGQSSGAMSVFDQLALYNGNNSYKGRALFRGAIMSSGSILPTEPVDGVKAQAVFDSVVKEAGCADAPSSRKLACLRTVDYDTFLNASNSIPSYLTYNSLAFNYAPRPDGRLLTASPEVLVQKGKYAKVPIMIGTQENEGTVFSLFQSNITTKADLISYLRDIFFRSATLDQITALVATYPPDPSSPAGIGTGLSNNTYPEFKRLAAILGDFEFTHMSRLLLSTLPATVPAWSYQSTYESGTPVLGTYHATDLPHIYYKTEDILSKAIRGLYISFVHSLDPNHHHHHHHGRQCKGYKLPAKWPMWQEQEGKKQMLELGAKSSRIVKDDARMASFEYIRAHLASLRL